MEVEGEREKEGMTGETLLYKELVPSLWSCMLQKKRFRGMFFRKLFSGSVLMRNRSTLPLKAVRAVRRV